MVQVWNAQGELHTVSYNTSYLLTTVIPEVAVMYEAAINKLIHYVVFNRRRQVPLMSQKWR